MDYIQRMDSSYGGVIKTAARLLFEFPKSASALAGVSANELKARKKRRKWLEQGVSVPPVLIISTTDECNLSCKECYSMNTCREKSPEMPQNRVEQLLNEASEAGCSAVLLAGGEPLLAKDWVHAAARHKELLGLVFTNGLLIDDEWLDFFAANRNMVVLFSIEGSQERTDGRRGTGVTDRIFAAMRRMRERKIPFGISVTTGAHNIDEVTETGFADAYIELGCRLAVHVEYVPVGESDEFRPLSAQDKQRLADFCDAGTRAGRLIYVAFPGNEDIYGGCLAAGRGFLHIAASGVIEPCPFAPLSDTALGGMTFIEALRSPMLAELRAEAANMREGEGGCSLRNKRYKSLSRN